MSGFIDIVCNFHTPETYADRQKLNATTDDSFRQQTRTAPEVFRGLPLEDYLKKMDEAGIERSLLVAARTGDLNVSRLLSPAL